MTLDARHIATSIDRPPADVYAFAVNPENLPRWAAGLGGEISRVDGEWVAESPRGPVVVTFALHNDHGILDHEVRMPDGARLYNPLRVLPNADGSEVVFTLFRQPGVSDEDFERDAAAVAQDLTTLKSVLEAD